MNRHDHKIQKQELDFPFSLRYYRDVKQIRISPQADVWPPLTVIWNDHR